MTKSKKTKKKARKLDGLSWTDLGALLTSLHFGGSFSLKGAPALVKKAAGLLSDHYFLLRTQNEELSQKNIKLTKRVDELMTRNSMLESDARKIAAEGLLAQAHGIGSSAKVLLITTENTSIVNHAIYANLTNRLQRICTNLDAIMMLNGKFDVEQLSAEDAAEKHHIVAIPKRGRWKKNRSDVLKEVETLFDRFSGIE